MRIFHNCTCSGLLETVQNADRSPFCKNSATVIRNVMWLKVH
jgi:hypothetical protein